MARPKLLKPEYKIDPSGKFAHVILSGVRVRLGAAGSQESLDRYDRVIGEWIARGRQPEPEPNRLTIDQLIVMFWDHAEKTYPPPRPTNPGKMPRGELGQFWLTLRPLRRLYGSARAIDFGPIALKAVRDEMIRLGWCRKQINKNISRLRMVFAWAVENELLPGESLHRLQALKGLRRGRSDARESEPVLPVPVEHIDAVLPWVSPQVKAMIMLELLSGARGGELCSMRVRDIDTTSEIWIYKPKHHKTIHFEHERIIRFGARCQQILRPFIEGRYDLAAFVFSPIEAESLRHAQQRIGRQTPVQPSQIIRAAQSRQRQRRRPPKDHYTRDSYRRAISRACDFADEWAKGGRICGNDERIVPHWHPHQLRHNFATNIRRDFGPDAANILLGHATMNATQIYAAIDEEKARQIIAQVG